MSILFLQQMLFQERKIINKSVLFSSLSKSCPVNLDFYVKLGEVPFSPDNATELIIIIINEIEYWSLLEIPVIIL